MKMTRAGWGIGLLLMSVGLTPAMADVFRPEREVRCNDVTQICYNRGSPSVDLTRQYFGRDAARTLRWSLRREERPRRLKAWFEVSTTTEGRVAADGKPATFRGPTIPRTILRFKIDGTRLKIGAVEGEFMSEGLDFHVKQSHDLVGGYHKV